MFACPVQIHTHYYEKNLKQAFLSSYYTISYKRPLHYTFICQNPFARLLWEEVILVPFQLEQMITGKVHSQVTSGKVLLFH